jgi:K+-transporting ATPase ATPase A chain
MARVFEGRSVVLNKWFLPIERLIYRLCGVNPEEEMTWKTYAFAMMAFNIIGLLTVYLLGRLQHILPLNPMHMPAVSPDCAFNTAVSFATNTNWQGYAGETTMSYLTQMLGLTVQNFVSAATGIAILIALIRGFIRREANDIGNFWTDLVRATLYILLPLSILLSVVLVSQGVVQTFKPAQTIELVQPLTGSDGKLAFRACRFTGCHQTIGNQRRRIF